MLKKLTIANFRVFGVEQDIDFAIPNGKAGSGLTILVGPNNAGKTTVLETIAQFFSGDDFEASRLMRRPSSDLKICVTINDPHKISKGLGLTNQDQENLIIYAKKIGGAQYAYSVKANMLTDKVDYIPADRTPPDGMSDEVDPKQHVFYEKMNRKNRLKLQKQDDTVVAEIKAKAEDLSPTSDSNFQAIIQELLATDGKLQTDKDVGEYVLTFTQKNQNHRLNQQGSGVENIVAIANAFGARYSLFLFDEPEVSLHPQVQKRIFKFLHAASAKKQIIVATHSPYLLKWSSIRDGKVYRLFQDERGDARAKTISNETLRKVEAIVSKDLKNRKLYDVASRELFFSDEGLIFTEGQEDVIYIENYLEHDAASPDVNVPLFGYGSGGSGNIIHWLEMAQELGIRACGLYDSDEDTHATKARNQFVDDESIEVFQIDQPDIRDKYITAVNGKKVTPLEIKKLGVFQDNGEIKLANKAALDKTLNDLAKHLRSGR